MSAQIFVMLLNPAISLLLAAAFGILWLNQRARHYLAVAAAGYVANAMGFMIQDVLPALPGHTERILSNACFFGSAWLLSAAILMRFVVSPPHRLFGALMLAGLAGVVWFLYADPSLGGRVFTVSTALGLMSAVLAAHLWTVPKRHLVDQLLFWLSLAATANFMLRPLAIFWIEGTFGTETMFRYSLYWTTVQFSQAVISVMVSLNLLVAVAIDLLSELKREASTDPLSGLLNRRGFEAKAATTLQRCAEDGQPACILVADLDHFKYINDGFGHAVGDRVIALFGQYIAAFHRPGMIAGRIGGEEFAILLPGEGLPAARLFAESLRTGLSAICAGRVPAALRPTASIGLARFASGDSLYTLLTAADEALYEAKKSGRDRVCAAAPARATWQGTAA
jgi:diguanylate cyclase (GGDEF)-like protein